MRRALTLFALAMAVGVGGIVLTFHADRTPRPDAVVINDAVMTAMHTVDKAAAAELLTRQLLAEHERMSQDRADKDRRLLIWVCAHVGATTTAGVGLWLYCEHSVLAPFRRLRRFARDVAMGNLDIPLRMDRRARFGAFTESFDLMREELKKAREAERNADRSKKELVASLSHDIKTPVASIKAATEVMAVSARDARQRARLEGINMKADQINTLITDMFHATLEELGALSVTVAEIHSTMIPSLIRCADYRARAAPALIPACIVLADAIRLQQVFDNVFANAYKYADTDVEIDAAIEDEYLEISISDFGPGVPADELPFITNKFYRGEGAKDKSGYGMGLFIARDLISRMSGELRCENHREGFAVRIALRLAG